MLNARLVCDGFAQVSTYPPNVPYVEVFTSCQAEAREANRGLWGLDANPANAPPAASPTPAPAASGSDTTVFITNSGAKYHADGCRYLAKSKIPTSLGDAKSRGYEPCKVCRPPG